MLHILLLILKIIGILLAALLGIILLVGICVLFIPIRYSIRAEGKLGEENPVHVGVRVSWLLHMIHVAFVYPEAAYIRVRVFGFTVFNSSKKKGSRKEKTVKDAGAEENNAAEKKNGAESDVEIERETKTGETEAENVFQVKESENESESDQGGTNGRNGRNEINRTDEIDEIDGTKAVDGEAERLEADSEDNDEMSKKNIWEKLKAFYLALRRLFYQFIAALKNIEYTIKKICDKIRKIIENIQYYTEVLKSEMFRRSWEACRKQLIRIFRMLRPKTCRVNLRIGMEDPAGTGQVLALYGILYPFVGNSVLVEADFENKVMEGDLLIKGSVKVCVFLLAAFHLFVDKNIRRLWKKLKKGGYVNGGE